MTAPVERRPDLIDSAQDEKLRLLWPAVLLVALLLATVAGVSFAARTTAPPVPAPVVVQGPVPAARPSSVPAPGATEPNANTREGRVPTTSAAEPNANTREGRVATTGATGAAEPNANTREGRVATTGPSC